jgi:hypothetical protein
MKLHLSPECKNTRKTQKTSGEARLISNCMVVSSCCRYATHPTGNEVIGLVSFTLYLRQRFSPLSQANLLIR